MRDLNDLFFFAQVVEHGGFAPAGRALGIPKSKLSRHVAALEERLGVRLIQRSTRHFAVTEIGQAYHRHCQAMLVEADAAEELIARNQVEPQGTIRLSCASAVLYTMLGDMIARFMVQCPRIRVQMEVTNRAVDVIREGFDLAVRVRFPPLEDSDLVMKVLAVSTQRLVASPSLLAGRSLPLTPETLADWPTVLLGEPHQEPVWHLTRQDGSGGMVSLRHEPRLLANDMVALHQAALLGVGVAALPVMMIHEALRDGRLVDVLPGWTPRSGIVHLAFPSRRGLLPAVRLLIDFLADEFAALVTAVFFAILSWQL
ncbi:MAG: LysR substrate-binding domain-containing protein, partial [Perlucidibaca sp.]